jgi:tetratricopeptide (TPR) repeat protein
MKGNFDAAIADYTEAIRLDPKSVNAYNGRAGAYADNRNFDKAIADSTEAIRLDPKSAMAYHERSYVYNIKGNFDKAIADSTEAVRLDPKYAKGRNGLGVSFDGCAKAMLRADAKTAESLFARAARYFDGPPGKLDAVQQQLPFDGSIENFRAAARKLDRAHQTQLLYDYSAAAFKAAIDIQPDYDFANNNLGVYYARRGGPEDLKLAENYFRDALKSNQRYADAYNNLGIVLARQGKLDDAVASHKAGLAIRNDRASDHNNLCRVYLGKYDLDFKKGDSKNAKVDLDNAIEENTISLKCDPNFLGSWLSREEIYIRQDKFEESAKCVLQMVKIDARSAETIQAEAVSAENCLARHCPDQAIDLLNKSLEANNAVPQAYRIRALVYVQMGDLTRAQQDIEQVLRISPDFPGAKEILKDIRAKLADPKKLKGG